MSGFQGNPCWYELGTTDPAAAGRFYADVLGWTIGDSGMEGMVYLLARAGEEMVAGLTSNAGQAGAPPPNWLTYFAADDCDATAAAAEAAALDAGRTLLLLDTETGSAGDMLYRRCGWTALGGIPDHSYTTDGRLAGATVFFKALGPHRRPRAAGG